MLTKPIWLQHLLVFDQHSNEWTKYGAANCVCAVIKISKSFKLASSFIWDLYGTKCWPPKTSSPVWLNTSNMLKASRAWLNI